MSVDVILNGLNLLDDKQTELKTHLQNTGFVCAENDHYPALVPLVAEICDEAYAFEGKRMLVSSTQTFVIPNLPQKPIEVGLLCKNLRDAIIASAVSGYVITDLLVLFEDDSTHTVIVDGITVSRVEDANGTWTLTITADSTSHFHAGYEYTWLVLSHKVCDY